jgi:hypothetical protein
MEPGQTGRQTDIPVYQTPSAELYTDVSQLYHVSTSTTYFLKIHFNIISHLSMSHNAILPSSCSGPKYPHPVNAHVSTADTIYFIQCHFYSTPYSSIAARLAQHVY